MSNWEKILAEDERLQQNKRRLKFLAFGKKEYPGLTCAACKRFMRYTQTNACIRCGSMKVIAKSPKLDKNPALKDFGR